MVCDTLLPIVFLFKHGISLPMTESFKPSSVSSKVNVCAHPLLQHYLTILRDKDTGVELFRMAMKRVSQLVLIEASRDLPLSPRKVCTPITETVGQSLSPDVPLLIVPILRAGLVMGEEAAHLLPTARVCHLGLYRDETTYLPVTYYNKLPDQLSYEKAQIFVTDPMLATGGSAVAAVDLLKKQGVPGENIRFACVLAAPEGIENLIKHHPDIYIFAGTVDERLNENAYIVPGLGDAGDRTFGTLKH
jgi:uracil phosphoribosyltransferase